MNAVATPGVVLPDQVLRVAEIDPISDSRWEAFVEKHPSSSVFHAANWLRTLADVYEYQSSALVLEDSDGNIRGGLPFCRVSSWLTGRRIVSIPFSDHCDPLVEGEADLALLLHRLVQLFSEEGHAYVEIRPTRKLVSVSSRMQRSQSFSLHRIDLRAGEESVYKAFHRDNVRRHIRRAEKSGLVVERASDPKAVAEFYRLVVKTRRRHGLPPQPFHWFQNLMGNFGDRGSIILLFKGSSAIAGLLLLKNHRTLVYKYGASDERFHNTGAMPYLLWQAAKGALAEGLEEFDLGRSDLDNEGLVAFKDHFGAAKTPLTYYRAVDRTIAERSGDGWKMRLASRICKRLPGSLLCSVGNSLYRHMA